MSKGRRSSFSIPAAIEKLDTGRKGALAVMAGSRPFKERYKKARAVTEAIDDLAQDLTGDRERFWEKVRE
ncbi:hypothetical protein [Hoeflea sp. TYP-13]|uniref:hypothetical protein n=1 Tax=Hoeflea sp. TYP-13 TaxID=3230023 RepID=UPI0034C5D21B